MRKDRGKGPSL